MSTLSVTQKWITRHHWLYLAGQVEVRRTPDGFMRGPITSLRLVGNNLVIETEWTAVQPFGPNGDHNEQPILYTRPQPDGWRLSAPRRFTFRNDATVLSWPEAPTDRIHTASYADLEHSPERQALIILYPGNYEQPLHKPAA